MFNTIVDVAESEREDKYNFCCQNIKHCSDFDLTFFTFQAPEIVCAESHHGCDYYSNYNNDYDNP
jgi:hypothetical protein